MTAIDLRKQQALNANPTAIEQINFTTNLDRPGNRFFITEEANRIQNTISLNLIFINIKWLNVVV